MQLGSLEKILISSPVIVVFCGNSGVVLLVVGGGCHAVVDRYRSDLMVKKLRYYARFIVVCLLLKKMTLVRDLVRVSYFTPHS